MNEPNPMEELLSEEEFRENTKGCFYQDELRKHDKAMREPKDTHKDCISKSKVLSIFPKLYSDFANTHIDERGNGGDWIEKVEKKIELIHPIKDYKE